MELVGGYGKLLQAGGLVELEPISLHDWTAAVEDEETAARSSLGTT